MKNFSGKILFLDRNDINTDEIIPAKYLTEISKEALKPHCLEDLNLKGFDPKKDIAGKSVLVTRANFGCGSSREHAPWALEVNGINVVIAESYARIFRQNMFNCGLMAIELPKADIDSIFAAGADAEAAVDFKKRTITVKGKEYKFAIADFDASLVEAGGWVDYADKKY
ncbi:MAG: 3-isopropylmalate dehydratase small subunit [Fibrobacteres bacterium]|nr:3-isopropylmalate dehydratase small subunit [Fibrobacterota bacterium]